MSLPRRSASSRRSFLQRSALGFGALHLGGLGGSPGTPTYPTPLRLGVVGLGRAGRAHLQRFLALPACQVLAVCDVYESRQEWARTRVNEANGNKDCNTYTDFRNLLRGEELDALVIATPDHWHAWMTIAAFRAGVDVFCESPGMRTLDEGREIELMRARTGRILQIAMPWRDRPAAQRLLRLVRSGRLGTLRQVVGEMDPGRAFERLAARRPRVPADLNYDLWLGPAPAAPYHPKRCQGFAWIRDYAAGRLSGQGLPLLDLAHWLTASPAAEVAITAAGERPSRGLFDNPVRVDSTLRVAGSVPWTLRTGARFALTLIGSKGQVRYAPGSATVEASGDLWRRPLPGDAPVAASPPGLDLAEDFLRSVRLRRPTRCPLAVARRAASLCYGVEIAMEIGREMRLGATGEVLGDPRAARLARRPRRPQWTMKM